MSALTSISITIALTADSGYESSEQILGTDKTFGEALVRGAAEIARLARITGVDISSAWKDPAA